MGKLYLLHFSRPYKHARHYLGYASKRRSGGLDGRIQEHRDGRGARLTQVIREAGIDFEVVRTWDKATRADERRLKKWNGSTLLCPICRLEALERRRQRRKDKKGDKPTR